MMRPATATGAALLLGVLATSPAIGQQIDPVGPGAVRYETESGVKFRFGISLDFQPTFTENLDFNDDTNFRSITEFGAVGEDSKTGFIGVESRLFFSVAKGPASLYTAIELDGTLDEREIDNNNPNIERVNLSYLFPTIHSTATVGADIYVLDGIGGLVYIDDDPGIWLKGGNGPMKWQLGYHKRIEFGGAAGDTGGRFASRAGVTDNRSDDTDFISGKLSYDMKLGGSSVTLEPFFLAQSRDTPHSGNDQNRLGDVGPGNVARPVGDPLQADLTGIVPDQKSAFLGFASKGQFGILKPRGQFVYHTGTISGLTNSLGAQPFGHNSFDINSWALFARLDLDVSKQSWWPLGGIIPFAQIEILSGDDDPTDDNLEGFVSPSSPSGLRAGEIPFLRKTLLGLGSPVLGDGTADFGMAVDGRGTGPTIGNILEGSTFPSTALFNNRFGKGDNPGMTKIAFGLSGALNKEWQAHVRANYLRFNETAPIEAEFASLGIGSVDNEIGWGVDAVAVYKLTDTVELRPFVSVFVPGDGAEQLAGADDIGYVGGISFFAAFF